MRHDSPPKKKWIAPGIPIITLNVLSDSTKKSPCPSWNNVSTNKFISPCRPRIGFAHAHRVHEIISLEGVIATATGKAQQIMNITAGNARDVNAASDWHLSPKRTSTAVPSKQAYWAREQACACAEDSAWDVERYADKRARAQIYTLTHNQTNISTHTYK